MLVDEPRECAGAARVRDDHARTKPPYALDDVREIGVTAGSAVEVEVAFDQAIGCHLRPLPPGRGRVWHEPPVVQCAHADAIATPTIAAPADGIAPVSRLGVV